MSEPKYFRVKNWEKYQHYKSSKYQGTTEMPWFKLYRSMVNSKDWIVLKDAEKAWLIGILCIVNLHGFAENDARMLQVRAHLRRKPDLEKLAQMGFIEFIADFDGGHSRVSLESVYREKKERKKEGETSNIESMTPQEKRQLIKRQHENLKRANPTPLTGGLSPEKTNRGENDQA